MKRVVVLTILAAMSGLASSTASAATCKPDPHSPGGLRPLKVGGDITWMAQYDDGCGFLKQLDGTLIDKTLFNDINLRELPDGGTVLMRKFHDGRFRSFDLMRVHEGRVMAKTRQYRDGVPGNTPIEGTGWSYDGQIRDMEFPSSITHLAIVATKPWANIGVLDRSTLKEVLAPRWGGIGTLTDRMQLFDAKSSGDGATSKSVSTQRTYLVALDKRGLHMFRLDGTPIPMPRFDHARMLYDQFADTSCRALAVVETVDLKNKRCHLYDAGMSPIVDVAMDLPTGTSSTGAASCIELRAEDGNPYLVINHSGTATLYGKTTSKRGSSDGGTATFAALNRLYDVRGESVYLFRTGYQLIKSNRIYRVMAPDGSAVPDRAFDEYGGFSVGACGAPDGLNVKRDGKAFVLFGDGSLRESSGKKTYPISC